MSTSNPAEFAAAAITIESASAGEATTSGRRISGPLRRLLILLLPANFGIFILWGAIPGVLLPTQLAAIDPAHKVGNLAWITTVAAVAAMVAQPIAGAVSDRTRSRFGRRTPWMVAGVLVGGLALLGMGLANGIVQIAIAWTIVQIAYNFAQGPLSAILPDRVPAAVRGTFCAMAGLALMLGSVAGQMVGASFAHDVGAGYVVCAGAALVAIAAIVIFAPDASSRDRAREPFRLRDFIRTFWVDPTAYPDFSWAFAGRLLLYTAYFAVYGYNLYILQDYIGLGPSAVTWVPILGLVTVAGIIPAILVSGPLSDRLGRRKPFVFVASVVVAAGLLVPWVWPTLGGMITETLLMGAGFGAFQSVDQALMTQVLPSEKDFAKDLGVVNIAATLPQTLAPGVGGAIVLSLGYGALFPVAIVLSLLGAVAVFKIRSVT